MHWSNLAELPKTGRKEWGHKDEVWGEGRPLQVREKQNEFGSI